jgi:hypothetical protein
MCLSHKVDICLSLTYEMHDCLFNINGLSEKLYIIIHSAPPHPEALAR